MNTKQILTTVLISAVTAVTSVFVYSKYQQNYQPLSSSQSQLPVNYAGLLSGDKLPGGPVDFEQAAAISIPAVVHIKTKTNPTQTNNQLKRRSPFSDLFGDDFFDDFFGGPQNNRVQEASGSGVFISNNGYIVTNNHVMKVQTRSMLRSAIKNNTKPN